MQGVCESFLEKIEILSGGICDLGILRDDVSLSSAAVLPGWKYLFPAGSQERVPDGSLLRKMILKRCRTSRRNVKNSIPIFLTDILQFVPTGKNSVRD